MDRFTTESTSYNVHYFNSKAFLGSSCLGALLLFGAAAGAGLAARCCCCAWSGSGAGASILQ
jgi:hypothetical protein